MFDLNGRSALVTGAGSGIGAAVAVAFAQAGARVFVSDIDERAAKNIAEGIRNDGGVAEYGVLDVRDSAAAADIAQRAAALADGTLHILVNNAGAIAPAMFPDLEEEAFRRIVDIHYRRWIRTTTCCCGTGPRRFGGWCRGRPVRRRTPRRVRSRGRRSSLRSVRGGSTWG